MRITDNIRRWPKVFVLLVVLTALTIVTASAITVKELIATAIAAGIIYALFAPVHAATAATLLDRLEGNQPAPAVSEETEEEYEENPESL